MEQDRILTLHPQGKKGVNILRDKYEIIKDFILATIDEKREPTFEEVSDLAQAQLSETFEGKVLWYIVTVKLDLEARGLIERVPKTSPQQLRRKANS